MFCMCRMYSTRYVKAVHRLRDMYRLYSDYVVCDGCTKTTWYVQFKHYSDHVVCASCIQTTLYVQTASDYVACLGCNQTTWYV